MSFITNCILLLSFLFLLYISNLLYWNVKDVKDDVKAKEKRKRDAWIKGIVVKQTRNMDIINAADARIKEAKRKYEEGDEDKLD